jgi:N-acetylmuramoyl-L-alanine amidase
LKVLISCAEGFILSETARIIYSPGYERKDLKLSEHLCIVEIARRATAQLEAEGHTVIKRYYDQERFADFASEKWRHSNGCDAAVLIALNSSRNSDAQFCTAFVNMNQSENERRLFEAMNVGFKESMPIKFRYPSTLRNTPFLHGCKRRNVPSIITVPFFYTDKTINDEELIKLIEASALSIANSIKKFVPVPEEAPTNSYSFKG